MEIWRFIFLIISLSLCSGGKCKTFKLHSGQSVRLSRPYRSEVTLSLIQCCRDCRNDPACVSISYQESTQTCDFSNTTSYAEDTTIDTEFGWHMYDQIERLTCKEILLGNPAASSGEYSYKDTNRKEIKIFCDFRGNYGYTFFSLSSLSNLSSLEPHYTTSSEVIIRNFRSDGSQQEATVRILSKYRNQYNLTFLLNDLFDGNTFSSPINEPFITLGFVPPSFGNKQGTIQGYSVDGNDIEFINCDKNPANSIKFFQLPLISGNCCESDIKSAWYDIGNAVPEEKKLPINFSFKFLVTMGGCGAFWSYDDPDKGVQGAALGLKFVVDR